MTDNNRITVVVRQETIDDHMTVQNIILGSFPTDSESKLVTLLRQNNKAIISLVASVDGNVVGHIMFSPVYTFPSLPIQGLCLGPVAVKTEFRSVGVGSALIREGLRISKEKGYSFVVLLGNPDYYRRFGFLKASLFGIQNEYSADEEFMVYSTMENTLPVFNSLVKNENEFEIVKQSTKH